MYLRLLSENTIVVFLFDTDTDKTDILQRNISKVRKNGRIRDLWLIIQVKNLEDELLRSTSIKHMQNLIGCSTEKEFKHAFIIEKNLFEKLRTHGFDLAKIWVKTPNEPFDDLKNDGNKIKLR